VFAGVRPSPGAEMQQMARAFEWFNAPESSKVAAAEDGRTPLTDSRLAWGHDAIESEARRVRVRDRFDVVGSAGRDIDEPRPGAAAQLVQKLQGVGEVRHNAKAQGGLARGRADFGFREAQAMGGMNSN